MLYRLRIRQRSCRGLVMDVAWLRDFRFAALWCSFLGLLLGALAFRATSLCASSAADRRLKEVRVVSTKAGRVRDARGRLVGAGGPGGGGAGGADGVGGGAGDVAGPTAAAAPRVVGVRSTAVHDLGERLARYLRETVGAESVRVRHVSSSVSVVGATLDDGSLVRLTVAPELQPEMFGEEV